MTTKASPDLSNSAIDVDVASVRTPFIARFATPMPKQECHLLRYDTERQVSLVLDAGLWVDALSAKAVHAHTRMTKVHQETTDDE